MHPIDGFLESLPIFTSCFFLPIPYDVIIIHMSLSAFWVTSVHDNINLIPFKGILYASSHSIHHYPWGQNYNFGKMTSVCDRLFGSYCNPDYGGYGFKYSSKTN